MTQLSIILYQPEIPPNTGNIIRLCANSGAELHLIKPLGFRLEDKQLRRAGLDYHEWANIKIWPHLEDAQMHFQTSNLYAMTTKGQRSFFDVDFKTESSEHEHIALLFGPETRGLPNKVLDHMPLTHKLRLPMTDNGRSLNLSNTVAIGIYEVWRQLKFAPLIKATNA